MAGVSCAHHVLSIPHLLSQFRDSQCSVLLGAPGRQGGKADHKEVETGKGHQIDCQLTQVSIQLTWESEAARNSGHNDRDQVIEITECGCSKLKRTKAYVVKCLII